ncbi:MAG: molecular chaperone DnaK [Gammaproteobacteria bacterium]|nr:MAG: molecular chaperone DnaK [Gammaproteobacteria bacterium]
MINARYLIGIDLGTTNTVVAYADLENGLQQAKPQIFPIEQLVASGTVAPKNQLPSFRYHPAEQEITDGELQLSWFAMPIRGDIDPHIVGAWGRDLGAKVDGRLVASAKSWLCHSGVDRTSPILPWGSEGVEKISPLVASSSYLAHVKSAWNCVHPEYPLELQDVVITIPASFDEVARSLTLKAAEMAGFMNVHLIEEPQAACYDWYLRHQEQASGILKNTHLVLVCDVGGGTTDLSLIKVGEQGGELKLDRIAVGDHLMLGGDNIDLALAHQAEQQLGARRLSAGALSQLIQQCRQVKETLLASVAPESAKATILGAGARLIGGAKSVEFQQQAVRALAVDGFLPLTEWGDMPQQRYSAVVEFGLPYASDPAVSKHICQFLNHHQASAKQAFPEQSQGPYLPDAILFNGGFFNSDLLRHRARDLLQSWRDGAVKILDNQHPDLAVAYGAVAYGLARRGAFLKIGGGAPRSYFLKVEDASSEHETGVCLLPKGTEEGAEISLQDSRFSLKVGQPVSFQLVTNSGDEGFVSGQVVHINNDDFKALPPSNVKITASGGQEVDVALACQLTEVGTLNLDCVSTVNQQRWKVEFDLRKPMHSALSDNIEEAPVALPENFAKARDQIRNYYGGKGKANVDVRKLRSELDALLGKRDAWDVALLRAIFDILLESAKRRRRSEHHERLWFNIAGFCMRPGVGFSGDEFRIDEAWALYAQGLQYPKETRAWAEWWTFWRRLAAGLNKDQQAQLFSDVAEFIDPANSRNSKIKTQLKTRSYDDMVRLVGGLEKLAQASKIQAGDWLAQRLTKSSEPVSSWWALGRLGAREPFYAGIDTVLSPERVSSWIELSLAQDWVNNQQAALACVQMARKTNDRSRDIPEGLALHIIDKLQASKCASSWVQLIQEHVVLASRDTQSMLGDALPVGIKILK